MFHTDEYDCFDDSSYYLFAVRDPLDRLVSAFNYDRPMHAQAHKKHSHTHKKHSHATNKEKLYVKCPFDSIDSLAQRGLSPRGNATEVCKRRAEGFVEGTLELGIHSYWNYQFHLEGIPHNARILTIRQTHLVEDWNAIEQLIGGQHNILGANQTVLQHQNAHKNATNTNTLTYDEKYLSEESRSLLCKSLCNEIQVYKKILAVSENLSEDQLRQSLKELKQSCPHELLPCYSPLPDITDKLVKGRGYDSNVTLDKATHEITVGRRQILIKSAEEINP
eukprot:CAMPEP_0183713986 /NCGR_PEP_ID=MMETSP0737-20130205/8697_1 /TAXON_ID=385413 /ORGANISM="Thalassiosira miniscula, Strain CCMP1093" /LENGTH=277 /DNA_ID=CAMNT_0025942885 /DNA_START=595 /DNA_END=1428 /DNA_ORIENTATION=-